MTIFQSISISFTLSHDIWAHHKRVNLHGLSEHKTVRIKKKPFFFLFLRSFENYYKMFSEKKIINLLAYKYFYKDWRPQWVFWEISGAVPLQ